MDLNDPMPERLRERTLQAKGLGEVFAGREGIIEDLMDNALMQKETNDGTIPQCTRTVGLGRVVTAPPGAGKTALLDTLGQGLVENGLGCIKLTATQLLCEDALATKLQDLNMREVAEQAWRIWSDRCNELVSWKPVLTTSSIEKAKQSIMRSLRAVAQQMDWGKATADFTDGVALSERVQRQSADLWKLLEAYNLLFPQGWVMLIDELQQLKGLDSKTGPAEVVKTMAEGAYRSAFGLGNGNIIMAGLTDSVEVLQAMNVTTVQQIPLGPMHEGEAAEVIDYHIRTGVSANGGTEVPNHDQWVAELSAEYHGWAHHTRAAAWSAEWVAQHHPVHSAGLRWIHERTQMAIEVLYEDRLSSATQHIPRSVLAAMMTRQRQGRAVMTRDEALEMLVRAKKFDRTQLMDHYRPQQLLSQIVYAGVLEFGERRCLEVPIPSLSTYCEKKLVAEPELLRRLTATDSNG